MPPRLPSRPSAAARSLASRSLAAVALVALPVAGCDTVAPVAVESDAPALVGQDVRLTILHTSDLHSRLLPYDFDPSFTDNQLGLADGLGSYGGMARIGHILKREREEAGRVLHLDSGDCFQGAIIFNEFYGEAEMRLLTEVGLDAAVIGNHEFDNGAANLADQYSAHGGFDLLAANYDFEDATLPWATGLEHMSLPSASYDLDGLRVGVIGMANLSSLNSIGDQSNSLGVRVIDRAVAIPAEAKKLRANGADVIVVVSHMGLDDDQEMAREFSDIDIIIGGHHHVAIDPPLVVVNEETGKRIPVVHSGAFAKFVGRFDAIIRDGEVLSFDYELFPVSAAVPEDPSIVDIVEEYEEALLAEWNTGQVLGYACPEEEGCEKLTRYGTNGGDSMLGNFTAEAMRAFPGIETEIALTNTLGIRSDINAGEITLDDIYNAMPFDNTITTMYLSGDEIQELLDYVADRSTERGCNSQAQVAGIEFDMVCDPLEPRAENIVINGVPLSDEAVYEMATNNYIANGGSGFEMLERNSTKSPTDIEIRDVVIAEIIKYQTLPQAAEGVAVEDGRINTVY